MSSSLLIAFEMLITLGVCLGFGFYQLWDLKRVKAAREAAEPKRQAGASAAP